MANAAARTPTDLPSHTYRDTLKRAWQTIVDDHLLQWAAALTFFAVISLFPALLAMVSLLGLIGASAIQPLIDNLTQLAPGAARDITLDALRSIRESSSGSGIAFAFALGAALWTASAYVGAFIPAANIIWDVGEARPIGKKLVVRVSLTLVLLLMIVIIALGVVLTGPIAREVGNIVGLGETAVDVWGLAKWPFLAFAMMLLLATLYWAAPNVRHPGWRWVTPGSVAAVVLWIIASVAFTIYLANFESYNATYGSIGGVLIFLLWLWLTNIAILLGAVLNAEMERTRAIEGGMRPKDKTPFLELRDPPDEASGGSPSQE